jgi:hypothetical protein
MANLGYMEALVAPLPQAVKVPIVNFIRGTMTTLRFGAPGDAAARAENLGGALVPFITSGTADGEVAVAHQLDRIPRMLIPCLRLSTVNSTIPELTVTRAADATYFYVSSPVQEASVWAYVE